MRREVCAAPATNGRLFSEHYTVRAQVSDYIPDSDFT